MQEVSALKRRHGRLSANDRFCLVTAQCLEDGILLTGDGLLRTVAEAVGVRVHGVLWIVNALKAARACEDGVQSETHFLFRQATVLVQWAMRRTRHGPG